MAIRNEISKFEVDKNTEDEVTSVKVTVNTLEDVLDNYINNTGLTFP